MKPICLCHCEFPSCHARRDISMVVENCHPHAYIHMYKRIDGVESVPSGYIYVCMSCINIIVYIYILYMDHVEKS